MVVFVLLIIPCGFAKSLAEILVVRFFYILFGVAVVSKSPGTVRKVDSSIPVSASPAYVLPERKEVLASGQNLEIRSPMLNRAQLG